MFISLLSVLEALKHRGRSKYKVVRAFNHYKYLVLCLLENITVKILPVTLCKLNDKVRNERICVSLTTFPSRIDACYYTIKTLYCQTIRPDRIVLWLADSQFPNKQLPKNYRRLINRGLEIRFCKDLRSHKKYFFMLQEQRSDELVITFDDDIIYHPESIQRVFQKHLEYPSAIVCNQVKIMSLDRCGNNILPYHKWQIPADGKHVPNKMYTVMSGSGTLYPYHVFPQEMYNWDYIEHDALYTDDIWISLMAKYYDVDIVCTDVIAKVFTNITATQAFNLSQFNCVGTGNDDTVSNIIHRYPVIKDKLFSK